jgi:Ca2+-binding RTX toxin-like protein
VDIENVVGSQHDDWLEGDETANVLIGLGGRNIIYGEGGDDVLLGGGEDDYFNGGEGADYLYGDIGTDEAAYLDSDEGARVSLLSGTGSGGDAAGDTLLGIENLTGSTHDDVLSGDHGANRVYGHLGNDTLKGYGGDDILTGYDDNDTIEGGGGDDAIDGGDGIDTASYANSAAGVRVSLRDQTAAGGDAEGDTLAGIENLTGSVPAGVRRTMAATPSAPTTSCMAWRAPTHSTAGPVPTSSTAAKTATSCWAAAATTSTSSTMPLTR